MLFIDSTSKLTIPMDISKFRLQNC